MTLGKWFEQRKPMNLFLNSCSSLLEDIFLTANVVAIIAYLKKKNRLICCGGDNAGRWCGTLFRSIIIALRALAGKNTHHCCSKLNKVLWAFPGQGFNPNTANLQLWIYKLFTTIMYVRSQFSTSLIAGILIRWYYELDTQWATTQLIFMISHRQLTIWLRKAEVAPWRWS